MRLLFVLLISFVVLGCGGDADTRKSREERRQRRLRGDNDPVVVDPVNKPIDTSVGLGETQKLQVQARAAGMRELARSIRSGQVKDVWAARSQFEKFDQDSRNAFDGGLGVRFEKDLKTNDDSLPSTAADSFEKYATEIESILK